MKADTAELDEDMLLELFESVTKALMQERTWSSSLVVFDVLLAALSEYEDILRLEDERLAADVEEFLNPPVYCPACLRSPLVLTEKSAQCKVG